MFNKLKQFKDLRDRAKQIQEVLSKEIEEGTSGWGKVKVRINGNQQVQSVSIDQSLMEDRSKLESLLVEAFNDSIVKIQKVMAIKLRDVGGVDMAQEMGEMFKQ